MKNKMEMIAIAKRENNSKRNFLIVNRLQGKHLPVSPAKSLDLFSELATKINIGANTLVIGFCETATAIGFQVAKELKLPYIHTTRENYNQEYIFFSEEHSHATEQKLLKSEIDSIIDNINEILFVEDEITTGKTILNIIESFKKHYTKKLKFSVCAIINGMNDENKNRFEQNNINIYYLLQTNSLKYDEKIMDIITDGKVYDLFTKNGHSDNKCPNDLDNQISIEQKNDTIDKQVDKLKTLNCNKGKISNDMENHIYTDYFSAKNINNCDKKANNSFACDTNDEQDFNSDIIKQNKNINCTIKKYEISGFIDARRICNPKEYTLTLEKLANTIISILKEDIFALSKENNKVLLLGTEELMYPAIFAGQKIEQLGYEVYTHSTTRSPISVSLNKDYPLYSRYELQSPYDTERKTFVYNLEKYDIVFIISEEKAKYFSSIINALQISGNKNINIVRWK